MSWMCIITFTVILVFNGFEAFLHTFSVSGLFASYITVPVIVGSFCVFKAYLARCGMPHGFTALENVYLGGGPPGALIGTKYAV